jgi:hypothetical protein
MDKRSQRASQLLFSANVETDSCSDGVDQDLLPRIGNAVQSRDELVECCFAIFADESPTGARRRPLAIFDTLEDAMDWALQRFKGGSFRLKYERFMLLEEDVPPPVSDTVV